MKQIGNKIILVLLVLNLILDISLLFSAYILYVVVIPFHTLAFIAIFLETTKNEYHTGKYFLFMIIALVFQVLDLIIMGL